MRDYPERRQTFARRALLVGGLQATIGGLVLGRIGWLALAEGERYALAAEDNRIDVRVIPPRRGWLVDRHGQPLALNRPAYAIELVPSLAGDVEAALDRVARVIPLDPEDRQRVLEAARAGPARAAIQIVADVDWGSYAAASIELADAPGIIPVRDYLRHYPQGEALAHVLGYVGPPTREQYRQARNPLYLHPAFRLGKEGVERSLDDRLTGVAGARRVEVNARGRVVRELDTRPDRPAPPVQLTLDGGLQAFMARRIGRESASVVVIDCRTGDVLCMLSMPAFDPNVFANRIPSRLWRTLQEDERKPLLNKVNQGLYVPGSTFKMVTALAALVEGVRPEETVSCPGRYTVGGHSWHCHRRGGHGSVGMRLAIAASCNVFFYATGRRVGPEAIHDTAHMLGLGQKFEALQLPVQRAGLVPDPAWKLRRHGESWAVADTLNTSIGQGALMISPMQLAVMTARLATSRMVEPRILAGAAPPAFASLPVADDLIEIIRGGMADVVNGPGGTARSVRLPIDGVEMGGKTGTAQVRRISAAERRSGVRRDASLPWHLRNHGLFVGFAPLHQPRYAVAVVAEHGGSGGRAAAPLAQAALTWLFDRPRAEDMLARVEETRARDDARAAAEAQARAEAHTQAASAPTQG